MSTVPADLSDKSDAELIDSVRTGKIAAYGTLYERHASAAYNLARQLTRSGAEADDLVSEAFAKVLDTLRAGKGPDTAFRAYLLTALRHTAYDKTRKDKRIDLTEDMTDAGGALGEALTVQFSDTAVAGLERTLAAKAFAMLPERWQAVLWHTEIEQQSPADVAPLLGLTANGVSALAYRAREGLRQAYLQVHLAETSAERCRAAAERLGAWTRDGLSKRERAQVETHLDDCDRCRALAAELADVNGGLRLIIAPMILGGAVTGYLAAAGAAKASAATAGALFAASGAAAGSGASAGAGAAASVPRQFAGVAASGAAVVAAVAVALASGGTQEIPAAMAAPVPAAPAPAAPVVPPAPPAPPVVVPPPAPPVVPEPPVVPPAEPAAPPAEPAPPAPDVPAPPKMTAQAPPEGVELQPGTPTNLPITVRNDGGSVSEPVAVALNLPPGVSAVPVGGGGGGSASQLSASRFAAQAPETIAVSCPGGTGTVTCKTEKGLEPGQSAVLTFRLLADDSAKGGTVTGSVSSGTLVKVDVAVKVNVKPSPADLVDLRVTSAWDSAFPWVRHPVVRVDILNDGPTTKPVTVHLDYSARLILGNSRANCKPMGQGTSCTTRGSLEPGERVKLWVSLDHRPKNGEGVTVTANLGLASVSKTVYFDCWGPGCDNDEPRPSPSATTVPTLPSTSVSPTSPTKKPKPPVKTPSTTVQTTEKAPSEETRQPSETTSAPPSPEPPAVPQGQPPSVPTDRSDKTPSLPPLLRWLISWE